MEIINFDEMKKVYASRGWVVHKAVLAQIEEQAMASGGYGRDFEDGVDRFEIVKEGISSFVNENTNERFLAPTLGNGLLEDDGWVFDYEESAPVYRFVGGKLNG